MLRLSGSGLDRGIGREGDAAKGKEVFTQCAVCHNADSDEKKMGPGLKGLFKHDKLVNGKKVTDATVLEKIEQGGNGMPPYKDIAFGSGKSRRDCVFEDAVGEGRASTANAQAAD